MAVSAVTPADIQVRPPVGVPLTTGLGYMTAMSHVSHDAMTALASVEVPALLAAYDFSGIDVLVDVAGGHGRVVTAVLKAYPTLRGVLFDVPSVVEGARPAMATLGLGHRCRAEGGDVFVRVPGGGDAYILKHALQRWDEGRVVAVLDNIHAALQGRRGKVLLLETLRDGAEDQWRALCAAAGFEVTRVVRTGSALSVVEAEAV